MSKEKPSNPQLNVEAIRQKLAGKSGVNYWRSFEEVAETPEFNSWLEDEFPNRDSILTVDRRSLLKYMGASLMMAGLAGCRAPVWPMPNTAPYVNKPEEVIPGKPLYFATIMPMNGYAHPVVVESHTGRPVRLEGNAMHPFGSSASAPMAQGSVMNLYDPDRSKTVKSGNILSTWDEFYKEIRDLVKKSKASGGQGIAVLMQSTSSPAMIAAVNRVKSMYANVRIASWEPINRDAAFAGTSAVFGRPVEAIYDLQNAEVIVTLDADIFQDSAQGLNMAAGWAAGRKKIDSEGAAVSRLYSVECTPTLSGAVADHRLPVTSVEVENFARALASQFGLGLAIGALGAEATTWAQTVAMDMKSRGSRVVVVPGEFASQAVHAIAAAINVHLGSGAVTYRDPVVFAAGHQNKDFADLCQEMNSGRIETLLILGGDPVFNAPTDFKFAEGLAKTKFSAHLAFYDQETSTKTTYHLPETHYLESWGDGRSIDGTYSIQQPLIAPLYDTRSQIEVLLGVFDSEPDVYNLVRDQSKAIPSLATNYEASWRVALNNGFAPGGQEISPTGNAMAVTGALGAAPTAHELEIAFRPDPTVWDGRNANNGWLQELPKPLSTLVWDNTIWISPKTAESLSIQSGELVTVSVGDGKVTGPAWVMPGQSVGTVTVFYGYGATNDNYMSRHTGFNAYGARTSAALTAAVPGEITKAGGGIRLAATQLHNTMEGRDIIRSADMAAFLSGKVVHGVMEGAGEPHEEGEGGQPGEEKWPAKPDDNFSMYSGSDFEKSEAQWGMAIDLNVCSGCHSCVAACNTENNVAIVGKDQVLVGREMHWIRIDRYYGTEADRSAFTNTMSLDNPSTHFMPVACMQCEQAPCEPVCPVAATVHSHEGLNQMVYNRCVGTRYCSNNCPYKVRRFNFLNYNDRKFTEYPEYRDLRTRLLVNNPNVTVRGRGVMEKCTFCVQRINAARINAKMEVTKGRRTSTVPADGEIITACQAACPTGAIVFGNIADPNSKVSVQKAKKRNYSLLEELNTRNRLTYLHSVRNPNTELENA